MICFGKLARVTLLVLLSTVAWAQQSFEGVSINPRWTGAVYQVTDFVMCASTGWPNAPKCSGFRAPATITTAVIWTIPAADGAAGECLSTNGAGVLSWVACSGGGSGDTHPVPDTTSLVEGSVDSTKQLRIEVDANVPTGIVTVMSPPSGVSAFQVPGVDITNTWSSPQNTFQNLVTFSGAVTLGSTTAVNGAMTMSAHQLYGADDQYNIGQSGTSGPRALGIFTKTITGEELEVGNPTGGLSPARSLLWKWRQEAQVGTNNPHLELRDPDFGLVLKFFSAQFGSRSTAVQFTGGIAFSGSSTARNIGSSSLPADTVYARGFDLRNVSNVQRALLDVASDDGRLQLLSSVGGTALMQAESHSGLTKFEFGTHLIPASDGTLDRGATDRYWDDDFIEKLNIKTYVRPPTANTGEVGQSGFEFSNVHTFNLRIDSAAGACNIFVGSGAPSGGCSTCDMVLNKTGGAGTTLYVCEAGSWSAL